MQGRGDTGGTQDVGLPESACRQLRTTPVCNLTFKELNWSRKEGEGRDPWKSRGSQALAEPGP